MDRVGRSAIAGAVVAVATGCVTVPRAADEGGPPWRQIDSPHFALVTDMGDADAREIAGTLEDWWFAMSVALPGAPGAKPQDGENAPVLVLALRSQAERQAVHYTLGGVFGALPLIPPAMSIGNFDDTNGREVLRHELAHAMLHQRLPRVPRWFTEGVAVYLQTADLDRKRGVVKWGGLSISDTRNWMMYRSISTSALFDDSKWTGWDEGAMDVRAGLLVHMLVNRHPDQLACYLRRLETAIDVEAALDCFPGRSGWDREVEDYGFSSSFASRSASFSVPGLDVRTSPISDAQVHAVLALADMMVLSRDLPSFAPDRKDRIQRHLTRALALEPGHLLAGLLASTRDETDAETKAAITKALVARYPGEWRSWVARVWTLEDSGDELANALEQARKLAPDEKEVLRVVAWDALRQQRWADARTSAVRAWIKGADDVFDRVTLTIASTQLGSCAEVRTWTRGLSDEKEFKLRLADRQRDLELPRASCE
jgi:hypothetical protein